MTNPRLSRFSRSIAGRVAVVTGAASGMGRATSYLFADEGAKVAVVDRDAEGVVAVVDAIRGVGGTAEGFTLDVSDEAAINATVEKIRSALGPIDILVNNAGISIQAKLESIEEAEYDAVLDTNLKGAFFMAQAAAKQMIAAKCPGRIVNIASIVGMRAVGQLSSYGMSKAGMIQMTHSMAREWGRYGINTNAIAPGYIATDISAEFLATEIGAKWVGALPRRRMGRAEDLDALLLLLCSGEASRFINGSVMVADDGFTSL